ncbi:MAG TPA: hypothetical protein PKY20_04460 [Methanothrix sp.]|nr:hypothetical protein [Methanothrix sp.]
MRRINVMVSDEAKAKLIAYQKYLRLTTQDETLDRVLLQLEVPAP